MLRCLETGTPLCTAEAALLARLNDAVEAGNLKNRLGDPVCRPLDGGLVNQDRSLLYPIYDGIPQLLPDEAIALDPSISASRQQSHEREDAFQEDHRRRDPG